MRTHNSNFCWQDSAPEVTKQENPSKCTSTTVVGPLHHFHEHFVRISRRSRLPSVGSDPPRLAREIPLVPRARVVVLRDLANSRRIGQNRSRDRDRMNSSSNHQSAQDAPNGSISVPKINKINPKVRNACAGGQPWPHVPCQRQ